MPAARWRLSAGAGPGVAGGFAVVFVAMGFIGRASIVEGTPVGSIWPAGGIAVLWFLVRHPRPLSVDSLLLGAASFAINTSTGAPLDLSLLLAATNVVQALAATALIRRACPDMWGCGGARPLDSPRLLVRFLVAATVATAVASLVGSTAAALAEGGYDPFGTLMWFGRNLVGVLTVTTLGLLVGQRLSGPRPRPRLGDVGPAGTLELLLASAFTVAMYALAFSFEQLPLAFPLLAATVWFGLRFPTLLTAAHSAAIGVATAWLTVAGIGPFAAVDPHELGAVIAQAYVLTIVITGLALSTGRDERGALADELRRTQAEALYGASLRDAIIGSMTEGLIVVDDHGEVLVRNRAADEVLGGKALGFNVASLRALGGAHPDGSPIVDEQRPSTRALRGETVQDMPVLLAPDDGPRRILAVSAVPLPRDEVRDRARALLLCRDMTVEHAQREELSAFAGVVAHDLRNPLAAIDGWTEMIADELESGQLAPALASEFVTRVRSSSRRMRELIRDLLAHATSSSRTVDLVRVDVAAMVAEVAASRRATDQVTCGPVPAVDADPVLLRQVVDNLLGNALKYVAAGDEARIEVTGGPAGHGMVVIRVADNGIGLPAGEHERIFEEFHRAHHRGYEGSGLGLSICRRILTRHGGTIRALDNPAGRGTVFELTLPEHVATDPTPLEPPEPTLDGAVGSVDSGQVA